MDTDQPAGNAGTAWRYSASAVSGDRGYAPIWRIHPAIPCPRPIISRAGYSSATAAISIAVNAALRATAGMMPKPTTSR
jgi:hypothetical protein